MAARPRRAAYSRNGQLIGKIAAIGASVVLLRTASGDYKTVNLDAIHILEVMAS